MTDKDFYRLGIIQRVHDLTLLQREAARLLELTVRQVQRVLRRYREHGAASIVSERRGRPGNNRIPEDLRCATLYLIRQLYADFGPTLATEKLLERHGIPVSVETVRNRMISDGLWRPHSRRQAHIYQRDTGATASANWFSWTELTMPGLRTARRSAAFSCT